MNKFINIRNKMADFCITVFFTVFRRPNIIENVVYDYARSLQFPERAKFRNSQSDLLFRSPRSLTKYGSFCNYSVMYCEYEIIKIYSSSITNITNFSHANYNYK